MNFQQLRIVREAVQRNFNLTEVANALFTSQSGVSKHILDLEDELGIELFVRKGKRLTGLTEPGKELVGIVERMLIDAKNIKRLAEHFANRDEGSLTIATTHTQARTRCRRWCGASSWPTRRCTWCCTRRARPRSSRCSIPVRPTSVATEALDGGNGFASFPFYDWHHLVVVPDGHALTKSPTLTLQALAEHPLITYHAGYTGRPRIDATYAEAGLAPDVVMSALDADVIKTYVEVGLGVGIIASMAFDPLRDMGLKSLDASHLFPPNTTRIAVRRGHYLRGYAYRFIEECSAALTPQVVKGALDAE